MDYTIYFKSGEKIIKELLGSEYLEIKSDETLLFFGRKKLMKKVIRQIPE